MTARKSHDVAWKTSNINIPYNQPFSKSNKNKNHIWSGKNCQSWSIKISRMVKIYFVSIFVITYHFKRGLLFFRDVWNVEPKQVFESYCNFKQIVICWIPGGNFNCRIPRGKLKASIIFQNDHCVTWQTYNINLTYRVYE